MHDVAIIGGGVSGCFCAFRLASDSKNPGDLALYETSERIGGRLWSAPVAGAKLPAEIGGMFFRANQKNVSALIEHLGLPAEPVEFKRAGQFVRGRWVSETGFGSSEFPFDIESSACAGGPTAVLLHALEKIAPGSTDLWPINREAPRSAQSTFIWLRKQRHNGRPLEELSLWSVLQEAIGNEAYAFLTSTLGTTSLFRNFNAFDGVWSLLHEIGDGRGFRLRDGYQQLPIELVTRANDAGAAINLGHRLQSVARNGDSFELSFVTGDNRPLVRARRVVLALPQRALQLISLSGSLRGCRRVHARSRWRSCANAFV